MQRVRDRRPPCRPCCACCRQRQHAGARLILLLVVIPLVMAASLAPVARAAEAPPSDVPTSAAAATNAAPAGAVDAGVLPVGADGKPLNLDFETGDLRDWEQVSGDAFVGQPVKGDAVAARRRDQRANHRGAYWIGTYEVGQDGPRGILKSKPFVVTQPWASFLVGGGSHDASVDLVLADGADAGKLFFHASGDNRENMERVAVDLRPIAGRTVFIRVVDDHSFGWGHINFDDFRFYAAEPDVPKRVMLTEDRVAHAGLTPEEAAKAIALPPGFNATLFAGEPDVHQPVGFCLDDRGRLWVAEAHTYPIRAKEGEGKDNILIFEDVDHDGRFDKRTVFATNLNLVSGIEVGFGGVWIGAAPYLLFIPDKNRDDKPDGEPEVLLDGWAYQDTHETLNGFAWGPDGWLYGCHGVFTHSNVGKPGTLKKDRVPLNAGVWRYHPMRKVFEVFAEGSSNPWGIDWNDRGQAFITACVIPHLYHVIQGARYHRQAGQHFNPNVYGDIETIADHVHWAGESGPHAGNNKSGEAGGGHAHCGAMIYLGGAWPQQYRDTLFMSNIHGNRLNNDKLVAKGSGYVGVHAPDPVSMNDKWSRLINAKYGPDGNVYVADWYDKQACHNPLTEIWDRSNGRIYKISYEGGGTARLKDAGTKGEAATERRSDGATQRESAKPIATASAAVATAGPADLQKLANEELVELQLHDNEFYVRHARRILQEREAKDVAPLLVEMMNEQKDAPKKLRALWALYGVGGLTSEVVARQLKADDEYVRAWAIQLAAQDLGPTNLTGPSVKATPASPASVVTEGDAGVAATFVQLAKSDPSPVVRLYLASALQRMTPRERWPVLENLVAHAEDAADANLPLMYWYAAEPMVALDPQRGIELATKSQIPRVREYIARRLCAAAVADAKGDVGKVERRPLDLLAALLNQASDAGLRKDVLQGMADGLRGWAALPIPAGWVKVYDAVSTSDDDAVRGRLQELSVIFGEDRALAALRKTVENAAADLGERRKAVDALVGAKDRKLVPVLQSLIGDGAMRGAAIRGLAGFDDAKTPELILAAYAELDAQTKTDALNTLASRPHYARVLMAMVKSEKIPKADVSAATLRQLAAIEDKDVQAWVTDSFGRVRTTPQEKLAEIERWKERLSRKVWADRADPQRGRAIFTKTCMQCHTLFDTAAGGKVGPDLTGSNRADVGYVLTNVLDPSAVIGKDYLMSVVKTRDKRVLSGIVRKDDGNAITLQTETEQIVIPKSDITLQKEQPISMMPEGLLAGLKNEDVRDLIAYLGSSRQVTMLATPAVASSLFNGKDLAGWDGDPALWKVENGEIVGKSAGAGLKQNAFLFSQMAAENFRLTFKVKLADNAGNSGVQFRSEPHAGHEAKGYQADIGPGWWGKLYEESGRGLLSDKSGEPHVKPNEWNDYEIVAVGHRIRTFLNGQPCVDLEDPAGATRGRFALQIHSGGPTEVRFKDIKLEVDPKE